LTWGWRLLPKARTGSSAGAETLDVQAFTTELRVSETSSIIGKTIAEVENAAEGDIDVIAIVGDGGARFIPRSRRHFQHGDILTVNAESSNLKKFVDAYGLELAGADQAPVGDDLLAIEAVILQNSILVGMSARKLGLRGRFNVSLLAVSRAGTQIRSRLRSHELAPGDVVLLQGHRDDMSARLRQLGCISLADSSLTATGIGSRYIPVFALAAAVGLILFNISPPEVAFFAAAIAMVLFKQVTPKAAYEAIDWPIIVMLGSLIPVGEAFKEVGAAQTIAGLLTHVVAPMPGFAALGIVLLTTMLVAPLMHHAAAVVVMGPIAAAIAATLSLNTDPFLMAVALGASCDFLTPIGHQNNLLVMGPGGYHFGDYWRLGLPLSILTLTFGTALIVWIWPLA
jgi:di/tricarboxylate transporter